MVQLVELGGAKAQYQTSDFLALSPRNLSTGFRVECGFGIDYKHQADSTQSIPRVMQERLSDELPGTLGEGSLRNVRVELREAGASSLDYEVEIDLDGNAAPELPEIRRAVTRILVEACNDHGWEIPFQQVTVHGVGARASN